MRRLLLIALAPLALGGVPPVQAQSAADLAGAALRVAAAEAGFSPEERRVIEGFYRGSRGRDDYDREEHGHGKGGKGKGGGKGHADNLPPGLAKRDSLPPGLAKRDVLPPGLAKRDLPLDLEHRLPPLARGRSRAVVGDDVVLIETATGVILDILRGVAAGR